MRVNIFSKQGYCNFFCVLYFFISDLSKFLADFGLSRAISYIFFLFCFIVYLFVLRKRITPLDLLIQLLFSFVAIYGLVRNAEYIDDRSRLCATVIVFIPAFYFFRTASFDSLLYGLKYASIYSSIYLIYYYITVIRGSIGYDLNYDMSYSRGCAIPACVLFYYYLYERKLVFLILSVFLFATSFLAGSRSAPMLTLACFALFLMVKLKNRKYGNTLVLIFFFLLAIVKVRLEWILLDLLGLPEASRNVAKIFDGDLFVSQPREELYNQVTTLISLQPTGYGPLTSRRILDSVYPHSFFYELQLDYGIYVGIAIFGLVMLMAVTLVIKNRDNALAPLVLPMCIVGLGVLMVSSSYFLGYVVPAITALFIRGFLGKNVKGILQ